MQAHKKMEKTFDAWFKTVNEEQGRVRKMTSEIDEMVKEKNVELKKFSEGIQEQLNKSIDKVFQQHTIDEFRFQKINQQLKTAERPLLGLTKLN